MAKTAQQVLDCDFSYRCPKDWDALLPTQEAKVRHCGVCGRDVHFCGTQEELERHARAGHCVAILQVIATDQHTFILGTPAPQGYTDQENNHISLPRRLRRKIGGDTGGGKGGDAD